MAVRFINWDLEIESPRSLEYLLADLSGSVACLGYLKTERGCFAGFELPVYQSYEPDTIERLRNNALATWTGAFCRKFHLRKTFNLGYEIDTAKSYHLAGGKQPAGAIECFRSELRSETVARIARLRASVLVSIYPAQPPDPEG